MGPPGERGATGPAGSGGGGSLNTGTTTVDFGAFPGSNYATTNVTGQAGILAGSFINVVIRPIATADHLEDEHLVESIRLVVGTVIPGTGFQICAFDSEPRVEPGIAEWQQGGGLGGMSSRTGAGRRFDTGGKMIGIHGQYTVAWSWI